MIQKIGIGVLAGAVIGLFMTSFFLPAETPIKELFLTKITATSMVTGLLCAVYAHFSRSKFQVFIISILIGILVFYVKYWITGHHFDPGIMGAFTGALVGGTFAVVRKLAHSLKVYRRLETLRKKGFNNYG
jgi:membrane associated rhomboid family serine protease